MDYFIAAPMREEWNALEGVLQAKLYQHSVVGSRTYYLWTHPINKYSPPYLVGGGVMTGIGETQSAIFMKDVLSTWRPAHIILFGIAGSFEDKKSHRLGDIFIPEEIFGYEVSRVQRNGRVYRPSGNRANFVLFDRAMALVGNRQLFADWQKSCLDSKTAKQLKIKVPPQVHTEPLASGNEVVASKIEANKIRMSIHQKIAGVEMEASGLFSAVHSDDRAPHVLMVRGVSDYADGNKKKLDKTKKGAYRRYAAENAARFIFALLSIRPTPSLTSNIIINGTPEKTPERFFNHGLFKDDKTQIRRQHLCFMPLLKFANGHPRLVLEVSAYFKCMPVQVQLTAFEWDLDANTSKKFVGTIGKLLAEPGSGELCDTLYPGLSVVLELQRSDRLRTGIEVLLSMDNADFIKFRWLDEFGRTGEGEWISNGE